MSSGLAKDEDGVNEYVKHVGGLRLYFYWGLSVYKLAIWRHKAAKPRFSARTILQRLAVYLAAVP